MGNAPRLSHFTRPASSGQRRHCPANLQTIDKQAVLQHLSDPHIGEATTGIPWPYTAEDFARLLASAESGQSRYLAIRDRTETLIGAISFTNFLAGVSAEIGYWLAHDLWGQGIMTAAVGSACDFAFDEWELAVIVASVFYGNIVSERVLFKTGFDYDGPTVPDRDGREIAGRVFVLEAPPFC